MGFRSSSHVGIGRVYDAFCVMSVSMRLDYLRILIKAVSCVEAGSLHIVLPCSAIFGHLHLYESGEKAIVIVRNGEATGCLKREMSLTHCYGKDPTGSQQGYRGAALPLWVARAIP